MSALAPSVDVSLRLVRRGRARRNGTSGRRAGCRMWLIVFGIIDLSAGLDGIGFNYGGGETLSSKVTIYEGPWTSQAGKADIVKGFGSWEPQVQEIIKVRPYVLVYFYLDRINRN